MEIEIIEEEDNPMLHRSDVTFRVVHDDATPSRLSVRDSLAAKLNKDADEVIIREMNTKFGMRKTIGYAKVYENPSVARDVEQEYMLVRNKVSPADGDGQADTEDRDVEADGDAEAGAETEAEAGGA